MLVIALGCGGGGLPGPLVAMRQTQTARWLFNWVRLGPQHSVGAVFILGYPVEVAMHLIILLIVFVALAAIIIWVADWTSVGDRRA